MVYPHPRCLSFVWSCQCVLLLAQGTKKRTPSLRNPLAAWRAWLARLYLRNPYATPANRRRLEGEARNALAYHKLSGPKLSGAGNSVKRGKRERRALSHHPAQHMRRVVFEDQDPPIRPAHGT